MSWSSVKTEAIILSVFPWKEADRRYTALTPDFGKVEFIGRGAQKIKAKLASHLEPFAVVELEIIKGKKSTTVISVERKKGFKKIAQSVEKRILANASLAILDRCTFSDSEEPALYIELNEWLHFIENKQHARATRQLFLLGGFLLRCLSHLGYDVQLQTCVHCKETVVPLCYRWHPAKGGLVCTDCVQKNPSEWVEARAIEDELVKMLRFAREHEYAELVKISLKAASMQAFVERVQDVLYFHVPNVSDRPFWSSILMDEELEFEPKSV